MSMFLIRKLKFKFKNIKLKRKTKKTKTENNEFNGSKLSNVKPFFFFLKIIKNYFVVLVKNFEKQQNKIINYHFFLFFSYQICFL